MSRYEILDKTALKQGPNIFRGNMMALIWTDLWRVPDRPEMKQWFISDGAPDQHRVWSPPSETHRPAGPAPHLTTEQLTVNRL